LWENIVDMVVEDTEDMGPLPVDRPLSEKEYTLAKWMLENGTPEASNFLDQLDKARVVARCGCGCASIDFGIGGEPQHHGPLQVLGEFYYGCESERNNAYVFIFAIDGLLAGLEVCEMYDPVSGVLPKPEELTPE
jgi:hypothetical protein